MPRKRDKIPPLIRASDRLLAEDEIKEMLESFGNIGITQFSTI